MPRKIVVLNAEEVFRSVVAAILEKEGYSVTTTGDLQSVLDLCKAEPPDLILTNMYLPGITGHEAMKLLREFCPDIPVLIISGLPDSKVVQDWMQKEGFQIFPKPFAPEDLLSKITEVIRTGIRSFSA